MASQVYAGNRVRAGDAFSAWKTFTPVFVNTTAGDGALSGRYRTEGGLAIYLQARFLLGASSAVTGTLGFTLPDGLAADQAFPQHLAAEYRDATAPTGYTGFGKQHDSNGTLFDRFYGPNTTLVNATTPFTFASGDYIYVHGKVVVTA